ncbi:MAG: serine/threonine protein phosphatase [Bauldia sp.]|nr:serine/threonine protein phosphatase [Bauldia sp.]
MVYAIGDVHGCLDLLVALEDRIVSDSQRYASSRKAIVLLGDVIDRGPDSSGVIEHLLGEPPEGFVRFVLAGNHETAMLDFLDSPTTDDLWLHIGGEETLRSYGVGPLVRSPGRRERQRIADAAVASIPEEHIAFLRSLPVTLRWRDYLFVHAGIRPNMPLEEQIEADLQGIRDEFTASEADHRVVVVHGHTPTRQPVHRPNRIAVDLGAFATGRLAAVRLDGTDVAFLVAN